MQGLLGFAFLVLWTSPLLWAHPEPGVVGGGRSLIHRAPDFQVSAGLSQGDLEIQAIAPAHHHFNLKAPMMLLRVGTGFTLPPDRAQEREVLFRVHDSRSAQYEVSLYLCDEAKTYCEKHKVLVSWNEKKAEVKAQSMGPDPVSVDFQLEAWARRPIQKNREGFIVNQPEEAILEAKQKNKPLLIDFFGIWCPSCNRLDERVLNQSQFQSYSLNFVKLKLDADREVSWPLKSKYQVRSYPTLILASPQGDFLARLEGFHSEAELVGWMKQVLGAGARGWVAHAVKSERGLSVASEGRRLQELERKREKTLQDWNELLLLAQKALESSGSGSMDSKAELWSLIGQAYEELSQPEKSRQAWKTAAREYRQGIRSGEERGDHLEFAHALWKSGEFDQAEAIYQRFEKKYPSEFTFYFNHAAMKLAQGQWSASEELAQRALQFSYGDNRLRATLLMAKALQAQSRVDEAKKLIHETLERAPRPSDPEIRTHWYLDQLRQWAQKVS
ncbi:MAG: thioredoxin fold domain-containing protein [Bdellovibrionia bacterium]